MLHYLPVKWSMLLQANDYRFMVDENLLLELEKFIFKI